MAGAHIQRRCLADQEAAYCAVQPVVFTWSWKTRSNRQVFRTSTYCGTSKDTAEYLCLASEVRQRQVFLSGLGKTSGSGGSVGWSLYRSERKSLQQVQCETYVQPPTAYKGRMGAVRLVRGDLVAYILPEPCCVTDRELNRRLWLCLDHIISNAPGRSIPLLLLDANGHTGLQMVQPKVWCPVFK